MKDLEKCPECDFKIVIMPVRDPLPPDTTTTMTVNTTMDIGYGFAPNYGPTSRTYKCINEKCWVTKIEVSWK